MDHARASAELGRGGVRRIRAAHRVEHVVRDVQPEVDAHRSDQREERGPPHEGAVERGDRDAEEHGDGRRRQERQPRRAEEQPAAIELRLDRAALTFSQSLQVVERLRDAHLRVLEERHLLLVPGLHALRIEL